jgi:hypothetical protein
LYGTLFPSPLAYSHPCPFLKRVPPPPSHGLGSETQISSHSPLSPRPPLLSKSRSRQVHDSDSPGGHSPLFPTKIPMPIFHFFAFFKGYRAKLFAFQSHFCTKVGLTMKFINGSDMRLSFDNSDIQYLNFDFQSHFYSIVIKCKISEFPNVFDSFQKLMCSFPQ